MEVGRWDGVRFVNYGSFVSDMLKRARILYDLSIHDPGMKTGPHDGWLLIGRLQRTGRWL